LKSKLEEKKANFALKADDNKKRAYKEGIESVVESGIVESAKQVVAKEYGIVFKLTDEVARMYDEAFDMNGYNGDVSNELPLAASLIGENGEIIYAFLDADYRNRAEPSEITEFLKNNK